MMVFVLSSPHLIVAVRHSFLREGRNKLRIKGLLIFEQHKCAVSSLFLPHNIISDKKKKTINSRNLWSGCNLHSA